MKSIPDPSKVPQVEGHPDSFPEVNTMPKGWDMSALVSSRPDRMDGTNSLGSIQDLLSYEEEDQGSSGNSQL
jgi:hypothetical protein